jgi:hypothetical protein
MLLAGVLAGCAPLARRANLVYMTVATQVGPGEVHVELNRSFIDAYKNRVTIRASFTVDAAAKAPNPELVDGDLHFAGRAPQIGLRLVGEIKNAGSFDSAVAAVQRAEGTETPLEVIGAWRLWPEHALGVKQEQDQPTAPLTNPNPDHVFEIHPITRLGRIDLLETLRPVEGYKPGGAKPTFDRYQEAECTLRLSPTTVTLIIPTGLYNDVHFLMEITGTRQVVVGDGRFVTASALDLDGNLLVERLRMVFVKGTPPERAVRSLKPGARLHVWGLPRVDLAEISKRVKESRTNPGGLIGPMPYEIIVVGVYRAESASRSEVYLARSYGRRAGESSGMNRPSSISPPRTR